MIEVDNKKRWNATNGQSVNLTLSDMTYWGAETKYKRTRVFCEMNPRKNKMAKDPCKEGFESTFSGAICLHM